MTAPIAFTTSIQRERSAFSSFQKAPQAQQLPISTKRASKSKTERNTHVVYIDKGFVQIGDVHKNRLSATTSAVFNHLTTQTLSEITQRLLESRLDTKDLPIKMQEHTPFPKKFSMLRKVTTSSMCYFSLWRGKKDLGDPLNSELDPSFSVQEMIAQGCFGKVYKALNKDGKLVALKVMQLETPWKREVLHLQNLQLAPHFVRYLSSYGTSLAIQINTDKTPLKQPIYVIVTEYIPSPTLYKFFCAKETPMPPLKVFAAVAWQILTCLETFEEKGIVHCDLKPQNVMGKILSEEEIALLPPVAYDPNISPSFQDVIRGVPTTVIDVGIANQKDTRNGYTQSRYYRDPIPVLGGRLTANSDLFSLGCILYELATKTPLFNSSSLIDLLPEDCDGKFHNLMHLLLVFNLIHRPKSAKYKPYSDDSFFIKNLGPDLFLKADKITKKIFQHTKDRLAQIEYKLQENPEEIEIFNEFKNFIFYLLDYESTKSIKEVKERPFLKHYTSRISI